MASIIPSQNAPAQNIEPAAVYGSEGPIKLRIATGGAGQTGMLKALAEAFINFVGVSEDADPPEPFRIAWLATDTSLSFNALASKAADVAITYHPYAEEIALQQGVAERRVCLWRDAFNLVGPARNPAKLPLDGTLSIFELFAAVFKAAVRTAGSNSPVRFLSRYDKSANNILESRIWSTIGQTPWSEPYSPWYHKFVAFPKQALEAAAKLDEYTLVDRGTWCKMKDIPEIRDKMVCFKQGAVHWTEEELQAETGHILYGDSLGNPAHALLSPFAQYEETARLFLRWAVWEKGGQDVIRNFELNGMQLHGLSPCRNRELGCTPA